MGSGKSSVSKGIGVGIGIVIGIILMLILITGCTGILLKGASTSSDYPAQDIFKPTEVITKPSVAKTTQQFNIKEDITIDDITYKILSSTKATNIGSGFYGDFWADGTFVSIRFSIRNDKDVPITFRNEIKLKDENGNFYSQREDIPYWFSELYEDLDYKTLQPKIATAGSMLFDAPSNTKELVVVIEGANKVAYVLLPNETQS